YALVAPRGTPADIVATINRTALAAFADPRMKTRIAELGGEPMPMSPAELGKYMADETEKWAKAVKFAGIKPQEGRFSQPSPPVLAAASRLCRHGERSRRVRNALLTCDSKTAVGRPHERSPQTIFASGRGRRDAVAGVGDRPG